MTDEYRELLLGCGRDRRKRYCAVPYHPRCWRQPRGPVTLDINAKVEPDLWCDLNQAPPWHFFPRDVPEQHPDFAEYSGVDGGRRHYAKGYEAQADYWDEIHAYEVLEHLGRQGDARALFSHFEELWRLLKPRGYLVAEVPSRFSDAFWGDPGHSRAITATTLSFLDQGEYVRQIDGPEAHRTTMSDYRSLYQADFKLVDQQDNRQHMVFILQAVKPSRWGNVPTAD